MEIIFTGDGHARCVYDEAIDLTAIGQVSIRRGSHVEPTSDACWQADMSPVNGPILGPFERRSDALEAEQAWLAANWLTTGGQARSIAGCKEGLQGGV